MRPCRVVVGDPCADELAGVIEIDEQGLVEELVAHPAVEALDEAVLHRLAGRDVVPIDLVIDCPAKDRVRGELGAIVTDDHSWLAAGLDEHRQLAGDPYARDRGVGDRRQALTGYIVDDVEDAEAPAKRELVVDEVERPARVDPGLDQDRSTASHRPPPGSALADCQPFLPVEPIDAIDAGRLALPPQQDEQPPVAEPAALIGKLAQAGAQLRLGWSA